MNQVHVYTIPQPELLQQCCIQVRWMVRFLSEEVFFSQFRCVHDLKVECGKKKQTTKKMCFIAQGVNNMLVSDFDVVVPTRAFHVNVTGQELVF